MHKEDVRLSDLSVLQCWFTGRFANRKSADDEMNSYRGISLQSYRVVLHWSWFWRLQAAVLGCYEDGLDN